MKYERFGPQDDGYLPHLPENKALNAILWFFIVIGSMGIGWMVYRLVEEMLK